MAVLFPQVLQGMSDLTGPDVYQWQRVESIARDLLSCYGFSEIRTPLLERLDVFTRSLGDTTDVVQKEMYDFHDRGGRHVALRPEGTAGVMRYAASLGQEARGARWYYMGPMFRAERPQAGRKRQFHQLGVEALGAPCPLADAEMIALQVDLFRRFGLSQCVVQVNSRGTSEDQEALRTGLREALEPYRSSLPEESQKRLDVNVLRILDAKDEQTRAIVDQLPSATSWMSEASKAYLREVGEALSLLGIPFSMNPNLVRGLDYYKHTVWEISHPALGAQDALAGGGRYAMNLGSQPLEGAGFGIGLERVMIALEGEGVTAPVRRLDVYLVSLGDEALLANLQLLQELRSAGIRAQMDLYGRGMKAQMKDANRLQSRYTAIRGESELASGEIQLKNMESGEQTPVAASHIVSLLRASAEG